MLNGFTTPADIKQLDILLKRGFHEDENLIKMPCLSFGETKPVYDRILSNKFTINNNIHAVYNDSGESRATIIFKLPEFPDLYGDIVDCITLASVKIQNNCGYKNYLKFHTAI
uniref:LAGLIDADG_2 domain-containing protein n=1 Tax=Strongyloides papillosus TaxID=174720 RepID=A0A0N5CBP5_STREA